ncbi:unnamed protein product, partial [Ixodes persulcatus]
MASLGWRSGGNTPDGGPSEMTLVLDVNPYVRYPLVSFNILFWLLGLGFIFTGVYAYFDAWTNPPASGRFQLDYNIYRHVESFASSAPLSELGVFLTSPHLLRKKQTTLSPHWRRARPNAHYKDVLSLMNSIFINRDKRNVRLSTLTVFVLGHDDSKLPPCFLHTHRPKCRLQLMILFSPPIVNEFMDYARRSVMLVNIETTVTVVGAVLVSVSFCGCVGALRENTCLLSTYSHVVTALLLLNLILGLLVFFLPSQVKRTLRSTLSSNLVLHYRDNPDLQWIIDSIQVTGSFWEAKRYFSHLSFWCNRMLRTRW